MKLKSLLDFPDVRPLTKHESMMFLQCGMIEHEDSAAPAEVPPILPLQIILVRLEDSKVKVSFPLLLFLAALCNTPGVAVTWAYTLCAMSEKLRKMELKLADWVDCFPMGIPTDEAMEQCWDAQKRADAPQGNGYDEPANWETEPDPALAEAAKNVNA